MFLKQSLITIFCLDININLKSLADKNNIILFKTFMIYLYKFKICLVLHFKKKAKITTPFNTPLWPQIHMTLELIGLGSNSTFLNMDF